MRKPYMLLVLLLLSLSFGCARNHFNVPVESYASRVRVLGVAPIVIDEESDIRHPQREQLISLIAQFNRACEAQLIGRLKDTGNYYNVSLLEGEARSILPGLLFRREKRDDASIQYNKYFWKSDELRAYITRNKLDAVMLIVVSGLTRNDRIYSNTRLSSLAGDYNYLIMTAQILDANGAVLWEYPNFRGHISSYEPMVALQYPDFSEAEANGLEKANIKFRSIDGIRRGLNQRRKDLLRRETRESETYARQFDEMISYLRYDAPQGSAAPAPDKAQPTAAPALTPPATPATPVAPATPALPPETQPLSLPAPATAAPAAVAPPAPEDGTPATPIDDAAALEEIVPAPEGSK